jgi:hypothetical protein
MFPGLSTFGKHGWETMLIDGAFCFWFRRVPKVKAFYRLLLAHQNKLSRKYYYIAIFLLR